MDYTVCMIVLCSLKEKIDYFTNLDEIMFLDALVEGYDVFGHLEQYVGDEFLEYRLRRLIEKGIFEMEGSLKAMRCYSIKLRSKK